MSYKNDLTDTVYEDSVVTVIDNQSVKKFLLGGNCRCIIENLKTGNSYSYKIKRNTNLDHMYYVYVESGLGDIYAGYFYVNASLIDYRKGEKGKLDENDVRVQGLLYALNHAPNLPPNFVVENKGRCSCCGVPLREVSELRAGLCTLCASSESLK